MIVKPWQLTVAQNRVRPNPSDLVFHATLSSVATDILPAVELFEGQKLHDTWQTIVTMKHPTSENPDIHIPASVFSPDDFKDFMAIRTHAIASLEKHGPNRNADSFPAQELQQSYKTFLFSGFHVEHNSMDPANAIGINIAAEWLPKEEIIQVISLIDKDRYKAKSDEIRRNLKNKVAGVSMGVIAQTAECSYCGNIATNKFDICSHVKRGSPNFIKGKKIQGSLVYDICRGLRFYELSYVRYPADPEALAQYIFGGTDFGKEEKEESNEGTSPAADISIPGILDLNKLIDKAVQKAFSGRLTKLIKTMIEREYGPQLKEIQMTMKPKIEELVEKKEEAVTKAVSPTKNEGVKENNGN